MGGSRWMKRKIDSESSAKGTGLSVVSFLMSFNIQMESKKDAAAIPAAKKENNLKSIGTSILTAQLLLSILHSSVYVLQYSTDRQMKKRLYIFRELQLLKPIQSASFQAD